MKQILLSFVGIGSLVTGTMYYSHSNATSKIQNDRIQYTCVFQPGKAPKCIREVLPDGTIIV